MTLLFCPACIRRTEVGLLAGGSARQLVQLVHFFDQGVHNEFHMCQRLLIPELSLDKYVETRIKSIVDDEGNVVYFVVSSRDVTAERDMYINSASTTVCCSRPTTASTNMRANCTICWWRAICMFGGSIWTSTTLISAAA